MLVGVNVVNAPGDWAGLLLPEEPGLSELVDIRVSGGTEVCRRCDAVQESFLLSGNCLSRDEKKQQL